MMPASFKRLQSTGAAVLVATCETCGAPASFGVGLDLKRKRKTAQAVIADPDLGLWYCREHRPQDEAERTAA